MRPFLYLFLLALMAGCSQPDPPTIPFYPALRNGDLDQIHRHVTHGADLDALAPDGRFAGAVPTSEIKHSLLKLKAAGKLDKVRMVLLTNCTFPCTSPPNRDAGWWSRCC